MNRAIEQWIGMVCLIIGLSCSPPASTFTPPNFIIILADDLGYGDISPYGGWIQTPHLDRMAQEGMRFTDFHSNGAVCSPTRAGLLTGRYPHRAGIPGVVYADPKRNRHHGLQLHEPTFGQIPKSFWIQHRHVWEMAPGLSTPIQSHPSWLR